MTPKEFFEFARENDAEMVDLKFTDLLGTWQHCTFPVDSWDEKTFQEGTGFDGSSIRGWQGIHVSDMLAVPDPDTVCMDPFFARPTTSMSGSDSSMRRNPSSTIPWSSTSSTLIVVVAVASSVNTID